MDNDHDNVVDAWQEAGIQVEHYLQYKEMKEKYNADGEGKILQKEWLEMRLNGDMDMLNGAQEEWIWVEIEHWSENTYAPR